MSDVTLEVTEDSSVQKQTDSEEEQELCFDVKQQVTLPVTYTSRLENLQKISQKKQNVLSFPHDKKLLKLSIYSKCQVYIFEIPKKLSIAYFICCRGRIVNVLVG